MEPDHRRESSDNGKSGWKWIVALTVAVALAAAAVFSFRRQGNQSGTNPPPPPKQLSGGLKEVDQGLDNLLNAAIALGGPRDRQTFTKEFFNLLREERDLLPEEDRRILDGNPEETFETLMALTSVQRLARGWAGPNVSTVKPEFLVISDYQSNDYADAKRILLRNPVTHIRHQAELIRMAQELSFNSENPWISLPGKTPVDTLVTALKEAFSKSLFSEKPRHQFPRWFPLLSTQELRAGTTTVESLKKEISDCFPMNGGFSSLYEDDGKLVLDKGVAAETVADMRNAIESERKRMLANISEPARGFELEPEFVRPEGKEKARKMVNMEYDAALKLVEAFQEADAGASRAEEVDFSPKKPGPSNPAGHRTDPKRSP